MNRVVHFEIQADDLERAAKFYREVFWRTITKREGWDFEYMMVMTAEEWSKEPGINGWLVKRPVSAPAPEQWTNAFVCTMKVDDFDAYAKKIFAAGWVEALPKFKIADMARQWYFIDTELNTIGLHQAI